MAINRKFFFDRVRAQMFGGKLTAAQVEGLTGILDTWEADHDAKDDRWLAYMLATAYHETDKKMQPIDEYGGDAYFNGRYGPEGNPKKAKELGNSQKGDGARYHGRGYVQLTGRKNYKAMSAVTGVDLEADPVRAKDVAVASKVMFYGMEHGSFTGRKLADYFGPHADDWVNARRIINGTDKANLIADHGHNFYAAISYTTG